MSYTPTAADGDYHLRATATYADGYDSGNEEMATTTNAVVSNSAPTFTDGATATRMVDENSEAGTAVGAPVAATDADTDDTLTYSLSGGDATYFSHRHQHGPDNGRRGRHAGLRDEAVLHGNGHGG